MRKITVYKLREGILEYTHRSKYLSVIDKSVVAVLVKTFPHQGMFWISKMSLDCDYKKIKQIKI
jgi:hypothetical protein